MTSTIVRPFLLSAMTMSAAEPVSAPPGSPFAKSSVLGVLTPLISAVVIARDSSAGVPSAGASAARIGTARPSRDVRIIATPHVRERLQQPIRNNSRLGVLMLVLLYPSRWHAPYGLC